MSNGKKAGQEYQRIVGQWNLRILPVLGQCFLEAPPAWQKALPFTYVFDRFCRLLAEEADEQVYPTLTPSDFVKRREYFRGFLLDLPRVVPLEEQYRLKQLAFSRKVDQDGVDRLSQTELRDFFTRLRAIRFGGAETAVFRAAHDAPNRLRALIAMLRDEQQSIAERIQYALTEPDIDKRGVGLKRVGPSCIAEIPGWLIHSSDPSKCKYPIVNASFIMTLYRLGIYNKVDMGESCFTKQEPIHRQVVDPQDAS